MERLTTRLPDGSLSAAGHSEAELLERLAKFEDTYETLAVERELVLLNMKALAARGMSRGVDYTMLIENKYLLQEMETRMNEEPDAASKRLEQLRYLVSPERMARDPGDDGIRDVEE